MKVKAEPEQNPQLWEMDVTCDGNGWDQGGKKPCYRLLGVDARDIYKRRHIDMTGEVEIYYGVICPMCGCFTQIDAPKLPDYVKNNAIKYEDRPKTGLEINKSL